MHTQRGYILFLLFSVLSLCSILIGLCFSNVVIYGNLARIIANKKNTQQLALSAVALGQALITVPHETSLQNAPKTKNTEQEQPEQKNLLRLLSCLNQERTFPLTYAHDTIDGFISVMIQSEQGKLNINSLYDIEKKKFIDEGGQNDRKKLFQWICKQISMITNTPSLFEAFEQHIKTRSYEFNDVTELLQIKEFAQLFSNRIFINSKDLATKKLFLTDLFTVCTEQDTINPWLLSPSWKQMLQIPEHVSISPELLQKTVAAFKTNAQWQTDWDLLLKPLYQKEYQEIPQEIKSILTTQYEANIFSLLLQAKIGETNSGIFTIVKSGAKQPLMSFDLIKTYQI